MRAFALGIALALANGSNVSAATFTTFTDRIGFDAAAGLLTIEDFNSVAGQLSFAGVTLTVGDLTLETTGTPQTVLRNFIDQPPLEFSSEFNIDDTALANVLLRFDDVNDDDDIFTINFATPVTAFGADFGGINNVILRTAITILGEQIAMPINPLSSPTFFGLLSDTAFSSLSFIQVGSDPDGFSIDNVTFSAVPLPAALPLFGSGLAVMGFLGWRSKRKSASAA